MKDIKDNLEIQQFTMNEVAKAFWQMPDGIEKELLGKCCTFNKMVEMMNDKKSFDSQIEDFETGIAVYENLIRAIRLLADSLQVPDEAREDCIE